MDTRLTELLPAALGLKNGDAKIIKNAGGLVISAFDSAMRSLIVAIYELGVQEIMVVAHSHCGACHMSYDHFHHEMIARGVTDETLDTIRKCGIDLDQWLEGFKDTPTSVRKTVETIKTHPLVPKDIVVRGFIIDSETGELEEINELQSELLGRQADVGFEVAGQGALVGKVVFVGNLFQTGLRGAHGELKAQHQVFVDNLLRREACLALNDES